MKRSLSAVLAAALLVCTMPTAFAASDIENHWAKSYLTAMHELSVINPSSTGQYTPDQPIMRWEFMRYINRAFDFTEKAAIRFSDVSRNAIYYDTVQIAVKHGYINGVGDNKIDPEGTLTREQAATILGRLHKYVPTADLSALDRFTDKAAFSNYSKSYVAEAVEQGYLNGYTDGTFRPKGKLKRGEIAKLLYYFMGSSLHSAGSHYTQSHLNSQTQNVTISAPCTLSDATIDGNLYITEGVLSGNVTLSNVTVEGDVIVGSGVVTLEGVSALDMVISNPFGLVPQVTATGNTNIGLTEIQSSTALTESALAPSAGGFADLAITGEDVALTLDAAVWDVDTAGTCSILTTGSTSLSELTANAPTTVTGGGSVQSAKLNVTGCTMVMEPDQIELASGVSARIAGQTVNASTSVSISPTVLSIDAHDKAAIAHSYSFTFNADKNDLVRVTVDGSVLRQGTDYNPLSNKNGIRLYKTFLTTLKPGTHTAELLFADGSKAAIGLLVGDSAQTAVDPTAFTFDKFPESVNYTDLIATLTLPSGTVLETVKIGSTILERGADYTYNAATGAVKVMRDTLSKKSRGTYTITFVPSRGSSCSCALTVVDSAPVNEVLPSAVDFDANTDAGGYRDISVTLNTADGATLKSIRAGGKSLEQDWQYRLDGDTVTINKSVLAELSKTGGSHTDLVFRMTTGRDPTLRINFVTTYALTALVVDDLGLPIEDAFVTFTPKDSETGTAAQFAYTDSDGRATVYVKRGGYQITAEHERFTADLTQSANVPTSRTVKLTGEILETVQLVVTNAYGAPLSGAVVTVGGKSITTGLDGTASFSLKRGNYVAQVSCRGYTSQTVQLSVTNSLRTRVDLS
ncbi:MAG: X2-like carbohydrate binding domain-containing protein [Eubacteriales bacterium]|nr:X2-like carbohydrate binding domain-containing protein [Eubacteriales bacterium]